MGQVPIPSTICLGSIDTIVSITETGFDQELSLAAFIAHTDDQTPKCDHGWGFKPLEVILSAYLNMIDEGKVTTIHKYKPT
ncbi:hypothetical protein ETB97_004637 [Aspergillus alliaceus]|uniref:Uncharacterized protein n=1 Tax=Petromyces alliaceus TaxID=209559 RepID=A0A8H6A1M9_PETAA|nr:hypothetical protein ETB97_004637 [Aspergillus burnettii]